MGDARIYLDALYIALVRLTEPGDDVDQFEWHVALGAGAYSRSRPPLELLLPTAHGSWQFRPCHQLLQNRAVVVLQLADPHSGWRRWTESHITLAFRTLRRVPIYPDSYYPQAEGQVYWHRTTDLMLDFSYGALARMVLDLVHPRWTRSRAVEREMMRLQDDLAFLFTPTGMGGLGIVQSRYSREPQPV